MIGSAVSNRLFYLKYLWVSKLKKLEMFQKCTLSYIMQIWQEAHGPLGLTENISYQ